MKSLNNNWKVKIEWTAAIPIYSDNGISAYLIWLLVYYMIAIWKQTWTWYPYAESVHFEVSNTDQYISTHQMLAILPLMYYTIIILSFFEYILINFRTNFIFSFKNIFEV